MRNIRLEIEYDGTNYAGWQVQNRPSSFVHRTSKKTIQKTVEKSLRKILKEKVNLVVSGRTDSGVHALSQVVNFKTDSPITCDGLQLALNNDLPSDISVSKAEEVKDNFHSRFSARSKVYRYMILNRSYPSALLRNQAYFFPMPLDIKLMRKEACALVGRHNFKSFCASNSKVKSTVRTIKRISITSKLCKAKEGSLVCIEIEADGFLYNMVRNIVGTLLELGRGRFRKGQMQVILRARNRKLAGPKVPSRGLTLIKVNY